MGTDLNHLLLVTLGSAIGGGLRYMASIGIHRLLGRSFPYGTLTVNLLGCLLMGVLFTFLLEKVDGVGDQLRSLLLVGFLGGLTTFSSFSIEMLSLLSEGAMMRAFLNFIFNCIGCLCLAWVGVLIGRQL